MKKYHLFAFLIWGLIATMILSGCVAANAGSPLFKERTANASSAEKAGNGTQDAEQNGDEGNRNPEPSIEQDGEENIDRTEKYNLSIMVIDSVVTTRTEVLEVCLENHGETDYYSGISDFILMKKTDTEFSELQIVANLTDMAVGISAGDSWIAHIKPAEWFGAPLDPGEYRIELVGHSDIFCDFTVTE